MSTKNDPGASDCYARAEPDEPMFILLARDKHAPTLIWLWSVLRELDGEKPEVVEDARQCIQSILDWQKAHGRTSVGLAQVTLAGTMDLARMAYAATSGENEFTPTVEDQIRRFLCMVDLRPFEPAKV